MICGERGDRELVGVDEVGFSFFFIFVFDFLWMFGCGSSG